MLYSLFNSDIDHQTLQSSSICCTMLGAIKQMGQKLLCELHVQRRIQYRRPWFEYFLGFVFVNVDCITRIYFDFSQHTMFKLCILFTTLATKKIGFVWRGIRTNPGPKSSTAPGPAPWFCNSCIRHWFVYGPTYSYTVYRKTI